MTLSEGVVIVNRLIEKFAIEEDFTTLNKLVFVKNQIIAHECKKRKKWK